MQRRRVDEAAFVRADCGEGAEANSIEPKHPFAGGAQSEAAGEWRPQKEGRPTHLYVVGAVTGGLGRLRGLVHMWALTHQDTEERFIPVHKPRNRLPA